ncbi:MAG TPA: PEP-CTERM sorting domain-containing protein [Albitalea sp.]|nr:PEP-CTERM sorting domain-containing protein [Albitalea sp.]
MNSMPLRSALVAAAAVLAGTGAHAANFVVDALANSSSGTGVGLATVSLTAGQSFSVAVDPGDLWSAGALPRWSNADGLTHNLFATGSDDSGQAAGTQIGADFGLWTQGNLTAPFGTLVGRIDSGDFFVIGTAFSGVASASGTLNLYYWDSNNGDNTEHVTASISAVPEPETYALMLAGLGLVGFMARRRKA